MAYGTYLACNIRGDARGHLVVSSLSEYILLYVWWNLEWGWRRGAKIFMNDLICADANSSEQLGCASSRSAAGVIAGIE